jgi:hypothetical protein
MAFVNKKKDSYQTEVCSFVIPKSFSYHTKSKESFLKIFHTWVYISLIISNRLSLFANI